MSCSTHSPPPHTEALTSTQAHTHTHSHRHTHSQTHTHSDRQIHTDTYTHTDIHLSEVFFPIVMMFLISPSPFLLQPSASSQLELDCTCLPVHICVPVCVTTISVCNVNVCLGNPLTATPRLYHCVI